MRRALVACPEYGSDIIASLAAAGWQAVRAPSLRSWDRTGQAPVDLIVAELPADGWVDFVRSGRRMAIANPSVRLVFVSKNLPPGLTSERLDEYPVTPVVRVPNQTDALRQSIDAAG